MERPSHAMLFGRASRVCFLLAVLLYPATPAAAQPFIYAVTRGDTIVSSNQCLEYRCRGPRLVVTDVSTGAIVNPYDEDIGLLGVEHGGPLTITPDGKQVYVGLLNDSALFDRVVVIDTATNLPVRSIDVEHGLYDLVASPDGTRVYASHLMSRSVAAISTATGAVIARVVLPRPLTALAVSPDGRRLYVANATIGELAVIDTATLSYSREGLPVTTDIVVSPDSARVYAALPEGFGAFPRLQPASIATFDAVSFAVTERSISPSQPGRLVLTPDGTKLYMTFVSEPGVGVLNLATDSYAIIANSAKPYGGLAVHPDGTRVYVQGTAVSTLLTIETGTDTELNPLQGGGEAFAVARWNGCTQALAQHAAWFGPEGGTGSIEVRTMPGCPWMLQNVPDATLVQFTSATSGTGPGVVRYAVSPQPAGAANARQTDIRIAGQVVRITQTLPRMAIDIPGAGATLPAHFTLAGWAIDLDGATYNVPFPGTSSYIGPGVDAVHVWAHQASGQPPIFLGVAQYGGERADVATVFGDKYRRSSFSLDARGLPSGVYTIAAYAHSGRTGVFNNVATVTVTIDATPRVALDLPGDGTVVTLPFAVGGWAFDPGSVSGSGIDAIHVWAFPASGGEPVFSGVATQGGARPDVAAIFGPAAAASGFNLLVTRLPPGTYLLAAYARSTSTGTFTPSATRAIEVRKARQIRIDSAARGSGTGSFQVSGWAIDVDAPAGTGVDGVHVWAFPASGGSPLFIGAASLGGTRSDVAAVFGPQFAASGYTATGTLGVGTFTIVAYKHSSVTGTFDEIDAVTCTVAFLTTTCGSVSPDP
jgi:DNA-binding beta-propeller fold protein YncE